MIDKATVDRKGRYLVDPTSPVDPRPPGSRRLRVRMLLLPLAIGLAAVVAVQLASSGRSRHFHHAAKTVARRSATADFALLRSVAVKPLPHAYLRFVQRVPAQYEIMPAGARESQDGVWLIPGHDGLCIAMIDSEGIGGSCASLAAAESEGVSLVVRDSRSGQELVTGAVPDSTAHVRALAQDGATLALATPQSSIYRLKGRNIEKISLDGNS